jgi:energy-coupling factor transport system ATP-binding protein
MERRIDEVLDTLGISHLRHRRVSTLSGGEAQKVALASVLTLRPKHLILDEPTSQLDPDSAHELMEALVYLNCHHRMTIILAEHRLERILKYATHWLHVEAGQVRFGTVADMLPQARLRPPLVELGLRMGWQPLPLSIAEAQPYVSTLLPLTVPITVTDQHRNHGAAVIDCRQLSVRYGAMTALVNLNWQARRSEIVGLLGHNGAGKSTLLKSLVGLVKPQRGQVVVNGTVVQQKRLVELAKAVGYVPQNPNVVLFQETLRDEVAFTLINHRHGEQHYTDAISRVLDRYDLHRYANQYPRDLSGGERQRAALAAMLAVEPAIILLDEPTRGLDYVQKRRLAAIVRNWSSENKTVIIATHDVEWIAGLATRCTVLERGRIIADGAAAEVLLNTSGFNTQLGELFHRPALMTVDQLELLDQRDDLSESTVMASRHSVSSLPVSNGK